MEEETIHRHNYQDFLSGYSMPSSNDLDLMEREDNEVPIEVQRDNRRLWFAGILSLIAGAGIFAASNFQFLADFLPAFVVAGATGLGVGVFRLMRKVFSKKTLSLPKLELRRKSEKKVQNAMSAFTTPRQRSGRLTKSDTDKVFMGVSGGLAAYSGINSTLIRAAWIIAFAATSGVAAVLYIFMGLLMASESKALPDSNR